jgi:K+-transporting ATPase c subunit
MYRIHHFSVRGFLLPGVVLAFGLFASLTISAQAAPRDPQASSSSSAATSERSLAAAARDAKAQKTGHAKKVITDEDMEAASGPLPKLRMEGPENGDEVVAAIASYKLSHTPEQTEQAVRIWYDRYDEMLAGAIQENLDIRVLREANQSNGYELCQQSQDYQKCQSRQMAEMRGARNDQLQATKNGQLEVRIQHVFGKVRVGLMQNNLRYNWFKIRTTNGIDIF